MARTHRVGLPLLSAGQAQKELTHNEALLLIDAALHTCCAGHPANNPPAAPEEGLAYICGAAPTGAWIGRRDALACWSNSGWRFIAAFEGLKVYDKTSGCSWSFREGQWSLGVVRASELHVDGLRVIGERQPAISDASGGATIDSEARVVLAQILSALRSHGLIASPQ